MLSKLSDDVAECYQHARECAQKAMGERDARLREDLLAMERRWLFLARSYELSEQINLLSNELDTRWSKQK